MVAALTMPSLIANYQERVTVTKLKKTYATFTNAYTLAKEEHGELSSWFPAEGNSTAAREINTPIFFENIEPYLNISKVCGGEVGCMPKGYVYSPNGGICTACTSNPNGYDAQNNGSFYRIILSDGTALAFQANNANNSPNVGVYFHLGGKGTTFGKDFFTLVVRPDRVVPNGVPDDERGSELRNYCSAAVPNLNACTAWVIYNENMDYLHCDDLSWDGKHKCN